MKLAPPYLGMFLKAAEDSFDTPSLRRLLIERFGRRLDRMTSLAKDFDEQVLDVYSEFALENTVEQLVGAMRDYRPAVPEFVAVAERCGFVAGGLEVLVREHGLPFQDVAAFRSKFSRREAAICQIRTDTSLGTGTLVGPDLVLTNHHVVASNISPDGRLAGGLQCRFDYKLSAEGYATPAVDVAVVAIPAWSDHAPEDLVPGGENESMARMDYALLRLDRDFASEPIVAGGEARGHVALDPGVAAPGQGDGVLILQHPQGKPMTIDIGSITRVGRTRLRHSVNTESGSSGSPVFNSGLELVAIHHAGHSDWPAERLGYNQAIPLQPILADARGKGVAL